jgi:hypothetical protein
MCKYKLQIQIFYVSSRPAFKGLSNGAHGFPVNPVLMLKTYVEPKHSFSE